MKICPLKLWKVVLVLSSTLLLTTSYAEPANLSALKREVIYYHDSGLYEKELAKAVAKAQQFIQREAAINKYHNSKKKLALVLDIDETSLSNYNRMVMREFVGDRVQIHRDILAADAPAITPMLYLFNEARKLGIDVFFVTGRPLCEQNATKINLLKAGFKDWTGLYLRPNDYNQPTIIPFKTEARAQITQQGYTIIASIGDQESDLKGGFMKKGFKLPNPYYYLP